MGWAIKRADGTYRAWNRIAQADTVRAGETWEEMDDPPEVTTDPVPDKKKSLRETLDAVAGDAQVSKGVKDVFAALRAYLA